jgi:hypothetical protein
MSHLLAGAGNLMPVPARINQEIFSLHSFAEDSDLYSCTGFFLIDVDGEVVQLFD